MLLRGFLVIVALSVSLFTAVAGSEAEARHWVKTCEGSECVTFFERLDGDTANVIISVGVRQQVGSERMRFVLMIDSNVTQHQGAQAAVYSKRQWARQERQEQVNDSELKPFKLKFASCDETGCRAEIDATPQHILSMKKGGGIVVVVISTSGKVLGFPVSLDGFAQAWEEAPTDAAEFKKRRAQIIQGIREKQKRALEKPLNTDDLPLFGSASPKQ